MIMLTANIFGITFTSEVVNMVMSDFAFSCFEKTLVLHVLQCDSRLSIMTHPKVVKTFVTYPLHYNYIFPLVERVICISCFCSLKNSHER